MTRAATLVGLAIWLAAGCATPLPDLEDGTPQAAAAPRERKDYLFDAVRFSEARKYDRAITLLLRLQTEEHPADAAATHYLLGSAYAGLGDHANAATQYAAAVAKGQDMAPEVLVAARLGAGHYSFLAEQYDDAVRHLSAWREMTPGANPDTLMELALAYSRTDRNADAVATAEAVVGASDSEDSTVGAEWLEMLADFYYDNSQYSESLAARDRAESRRLAIAQSSPAQGKLTGTGRKRPDRALPDTDTLRALQTQTRALLRQ